MLVKHGYVILIFYDSFCSGNEVEQDDRTYLIVNGEDIVYVGEDYENPETGEYVRWDTSSRGVDKSFFFLHPLFTYNFGLYRT